MAAADYDLFVEQGTTFRFTMTYGYKDGTQDVDGNDNVIAYDITGCVLRMQIRKRQGAEVLISATTTNGGIVIDNDPTTGKFVVTLTDEVTDTLDVTKAKYDLEIGWPSGDVHRIIQGTVKISPNITQGADRSGISSGLGPLRDVGQQDVDVDPLVRNQPSTAGQ